MLKNNKGEKLGHIKFPAARTTLAKKEEGFFQKLMKMITPPPKGVKGSQISSMRVNLNLSRR